MTEQTVVTGDEVAGLLAPEIAAMSRELEKLRTAVADKDFEIASLNSRLSEAYREIEVHYNHSITANTLLTEKHRELVGTVKALRNSQRTEHLLANKLDGLSTELQGIKHYCINVLDTDKDKGNSPYQSYTAFDLVHQIVTGAELVIPEDRPYIASEAVERRLEEISKRRSEVVDAHAAATAAVAANHPMQESSHENSSTSGEVLQSE